jgi:2'-hydroxyisoflavone reductase
MTKSRREFLNTGLRAGAAISVLGSSALGSARTLRPEPERLARRAPHPLRILILGGTSFLGPHQIAYAMNRGHSISIFTRGQTEPTVHQGLFKDVEHLIGDRADNLEALKSRTWDAVIDNSGSQAAWTRDSARLLRDSADLYLYTSSTGVYYPYLGSDIGEDTELVLEVPAGIDEEQEMEYGFGVMKANSEIEARREFGADRTIVVRPTYMMGPADRTNRFAYWPVRLARGGEILVPGHGNDPVQYVDVRDVAEWMIRLLENWNMGTFNAVGPASATGMHAFVYGAHAAFNSAASFVMIPDYEFLQELGVGYSIPWIRPTGDNFGSARVNNQHGVANGLTFRPLAESAKDIHEWWFSDAVPQERRDRMESGPRSLMAREAGIIAAWKARQ